MRIVLPEGTEERTLKAADQALAEGLASIILIGNPATIGKMATEHGLRHLASAIIVDPLQHDKKKIYTDLLFNIRQAKGLSYTDAEKLVENPLYLAVLMIK
ncbi:MAG TPA: phosphate acyltransferase, partial [Bacteroidales bacterium]|nr:phosphate acyltransferase [Bacteroidales bacterium]